MSIPMPFSDLSKPSNDLLTKDFPVVGHKLEIKTFAPNNVVSLPSLTCSDYRD